LVGDGLQVGDEIAFLGQRRESHGAEVEGGVEGSEELHAILRMELGFGVVGAGHGEGSLRCYFDRNIVFVTILEFKSPRGADVFGSSWLSSKIDGSLTCLNLNVQLIKVFNFMR